MPFLVNIGLFVIGEMVVIVSTDILQTFKRGLLKRGRYEDGGMKRRKKVMGLISDTPR